MVSKIDRAKYGPGLFEVTLGALLGIILGVVLALGYLVLKPIAIVHVVPKDAPPYSVYYIEGSKDPNRGRQWLRKRQIFVEGGSVAVTEDDLNTWVAGITPTSKPGEDSKVGFLEKAQPNFRIHNNLLQIGVPCKLNALGVNLAVIVQADGTFVKKGDVFVYDPSTLYVGSCPLHRFGRVGSALLGIFLRPSQIPEDVATAWRKLTDVSIDGNMLKLGMP